MLPHSRKSRPPRGFRGNDGSFTDGDDGRYVGSRKIVGREEHVDSSRFLSRSNHSSSTLLFLRSHPWDNSHENNNDDDIAESWKSVGISDSFTMRKTSSPSRNTSSRASFSQTSSRRGVIFGRKSDKTSSSSSSSRRRREQSLSLSSLQKNNRVVGRSTIPEPPGSPLRRPLPAIVVRQHQGIQNHESPSSLVMSPRTRSCRNRRSNSTQSLSSSHPHARMLTPKKSNTARSYSSRFLIDKSDDSSTITSSTSTTTRSHSCSSLRLSPTTTYDVDSPLPVVTRTKSIRIDAQLEHELWSTCSIAAASGEERGNTTIASCVEDDEDGDPSAVAGRGGEKEASPLLIFHINSPSTPDKSPISAVEKLRREVSIISTLTSGNRSIVEYDNDDDGFRFQQTDQQRRRRRDCKSTNQQSWKRSSPRQMVVTTKLHNVDRVDSFSTASSTLNKSAFDTMDLRISGRTQLSQSAGESTIQSQPEIKHFGTRQGPSSLASSSLSLTDIFSWNKSKSNVTSSPTTSNSSDPKTSAGRNKTRTTSSRRPKLRELQEAPMWQENSRTTSTTTSLENSCKSSFDDESEVDQQPEKDYRQFFASWMASTPGLQSIQEERDAEREQVSSSGQTMPESNEYYRQCFARLSSSSPHNTLIFVDDDETSWSCDSSLQPPSGMESSVSCSEVSEQEDELAGRGGGLQLIPSPRGAWRSESAAVTEENKAAAKRSILRQWTERVA